MNYAIREALTSDHTAVLELWAKLTFELPQTHDQPFGTPVKQERLEMLNQVLSNSLANSQASIFIAETDKVVGTIAVVLNQQSGFREPNSAVLYNLWVEESCRRRGIASDLVKNAQTWLKNARATSVQVGWHPNSAADQFWKTQGFTHYETIAAKRV